MGLVAVSTTAAMVVRFEENILCTSLYNYASTNVLAKQFNLTIIEMDDFKRIQSINLPR